MRLRVAFLFFSVFTVAAQTTAQKPLTIEAIFAEANVPAQWTSYTPMNAERSAALKETGHITEKQDAKEGPACKKK